MDKRATATAGLEFCVTWEVDAIVESDTVAFASKLKQSLTARTEAGFGLKQMITRPTDNGMVLVYQKTMAPHAARTSTNPRIGGN